MNWISTKKEKPRPYQKVKAKGKWECDGVLYLDDKDDGWEQKTRGQIEVTHWKPIKSSLKS